MTAKKKPEPSAEEIAAKELVRLAKEQVLRVITRDLPAFEKLSTTASPPSPASNASTPLSS